MQRGTKTGYNLLMVCFLLSGAAGLIYEVVWSRQLTLFVGITTYAHTAVITAYMLGLALGSYFVGRYCDRHNFPLRLFAWLEVAIALYAATTPWLCTWLQLFYTEVARDVGITGLPSHLLRFVFVLILLLPPTFLMGGTLPVMVRAMTAGLADLPGTSGRLYGINTMGAVLGTLAAGYFLLPAVGLRNTLFIGVFLDLMVAVIILVMFREWRVEPVDASKPERPIAARETGGGALCLLVLFALSGFAALSYQISWIRALTLVLGSSVYSFSATLATFLAGIGLGSLVYRHLPGGGSDQSRYRQAAWITAMTGFSAVLGLSIIGRLPEIFLWGFHQSWNTHFAIFQLFTFIMCFLVMIAPTFLLGTMFPLMAVVWTRRPDSMGRDVGVIYAANTVGCIFGSMLTGLLLLPALGVHGAVMLAAGVHILVGAGFFWNSCDSGRKGPCMAVMAGLCSVFGLVVWLVPAWDRAIMTSGVFNYADSMVAETAHQGVMNRAGAFSMLYYKDGRDSTVNILERDGQRMLVINGKIDASSSSDLPTQIMLGHLPMLTHPNPKNVLVIGLGSGITAGMITLHDSLERMDIVEISPEVVEASRFFNGENHRVLEDPRVHLVVADARNYLLATDQRYDVIITQPSNPWISGVANLFTRDFFQLLHSRLQPGGMVAQWFQIYNMSRLDTRSVLKSYHQVFPHVSTWLSMDVDLIMLGSDSPHTLDSFRVRELAMDQADILYSLRVINMNSFGQIMKMYLFGDDVLARYCEDAPLNTDDRPRVEFSAPRNIYRQTTEKTLREIVGFLGERTSDVPAVNLGRWVGNDFQIPSANITVSADVAPRPEEWSIERPVWRKLIALAPGEPEVLGVGSQVWFSWKDGETQNRLKSFFLEKEQSLEQLSGYLREYVKDPLLAGGEVDLPGKLRGVWLLSQKEGDATMTFTITWIAPSPFGNYFQHVAERDLQNPGQDGWGPALIAFAKNFHSAP